jgi:hypothetical protein
VIEGLDSSRNVALHRSIVELTNSVLHDFVSVLQTMQLHTCEGPDVCDLLWSDDYELHADCIHCGQHQLKRTTGLQLEAIAHQPDVCVIRGAPVRLSRLLR